jgi:transketolase
MANFKKIAELAKLIRYYVLVSTAAAGSGHPSSCLSAVDLLTTLYFGGFLRYDLNHPKYHNNDRVIFSKGTARRYFIRCMRLRTS